jgi:hypothetical protein
MYREWWHPDPTRSPWKTIRHRGYVVTTCLFCEHEYATITTREQDNHHSWCKWWHSYEGYLQQQHRDV